MRSTSLAMAGALSLSVAACVSIGAPSASPPPSPSIASSPTAVTPRPSASPAPATASPSPRPTPTAQPTPGLPVSGRVAFTDLGYAVTLPEGWLRLDFENQLVGFYGQAEVANPDLASLCEERLLTVEECLSGFAQQVQMSLQSSGAGEAALDMLTLGYYVPTFALFLNGGPAGGATIEDAVVTTKQAIKGFTKGRVTSGLLEVPAGKVGYVNYTISVLKLDLRIRQFLIIANGALLSFAVYGATTDDALAEKADAMIQSFEVLR